MLLSQNEKEIVQRLKHVTKSKFYDSRATKEKQLIHLESAAILRTNLPDGISSLLSPVEIDLTQQYSLT